MTTIFYFKVKEIVTILPRIRKSSLTIPTRPTNRARSLESDEPSCGTRRRALGLWCRRRTLRPIDVSRGRACRIAAREAEELAGRVIGDCRLRRGWNKRATVRTCAKIQGSIADCQQLGAHANHFGAAAGKALSLTMSSFARRRCGFVGAGNPSYLDRSPN